MIGFEPDRRSQVLVGAGAVKTTTTLLKAAALADLYGFVGYALDLLSADRHMPGHDHEALDWMATTIRGKRRRGALDIIHDAVALALRRLARVDDERLWPPLSG